MTNDLPRLFSPSRKFLLFRVMGNAMLQVLLAIALALFTRSALQALRAQEVAHTDLAVVMLAAAGIYALRIVEAVDAEQLGQRYVTSVRLRILKRLLRFSGRSINTQSGYGLTMTRLTSDLNSLRNWVALGIARGSVALISLIGLTLIIGALDFSIGMVFLVWIGVVTAVSYVLTRVLQTRVREARRHRGRLANIVGDLVLFARESRLFGRGHKDMQRVQRQSNRVRQAMSNRIFCSQSLRMLPTASLPMAWVGVLYFVTGVDTENFVAALLMFSLAANSLAQIARAMDYRINFIEGRRRIRQALAVRRTRESTAAIDLPCQKPLDFSVELPDYRIVSGSRQAAVLQARAGEKLCLGEFNTHAEQLFSLITRLQEQKDAVVRLDALDIAGYTLPSLHTAVQWVTPELKFRRGSIRDNLKYAADDDYAIETALLMCGLYVSGELPDGADTQDVHSLPQSIQARIRLARAAALRPGLLLVSDSMLWQEHAVFSYFIDTIEWLGCTVILASDTAVELDSICFSSVTAGNFFQKDQDNATICA